MIQHKCLGKFCPGYSYKASDIAHPPTCVKNNFINILKLFTSYVRYEGEDNWKTYKLGVDEVNFFLRCAEDWLKEQEDKSNE